MSLQIGDAAPDFTLPDQNGDVVGFQLLPAIAEVTGFFGAARGVVLGIEVQNNLRSAQ